MPNSKSKEILDSIRSRNYSALKSAVTKDPSPARSAQVIVAAAGAGWKHGMELLLNNGADLNASFRNYRPLHALIQSEPHGKNSELTAEKLEVLKWVLANGADPELPGAWPSSRAIIVAAFMGEQDCVDVLRESGAVIDGFVAAALGDAHAVEKLIRKNASFPTDRDPSGLTALHCVSGSRLGAKQKKIRDNLLKIARVLLDNGAEVAAQVRSWAHDVDAVYFSVSSGQHSIFELLLERGADPDQALTPAVWRGAMEFAEAALNAGGNLDRAIDNDRPLLNQMVRWGQFKQAMWMIEHGANPNIADANGWTAVHQAASRGNEKMMRALLEAGGDPQKEDDTGSTPIDIARYRRRTKLIELLKTDRGKRNVAHP